MIAEKVAFLYKFLRSPKRVGSVTPSSAFLAQAMLKFVEWEQTSSIVELGAGTGAFTRHIERCRNGDCKVMVFEQDNQMRMNLKRQFPDFYYRSFAENIHLDIRDMDVEGVDCIISGLPFANFSQDLRDRILDGVMESLKPGGKFIAFQYSLQMKNQLERYFADMEVAFVPLNIPPAFVYRCVKR